MRTRATVINQMYAPSETRTVSTYDWTGTPASWVIETPNTTQAFAGGQLVHSETSTIVDLAQGRGVKPVDHSRRIVHYINSTVLDTYNYAGGVPTSQRHYVTGNYVGPSNFGFLAMPDFPNVSVTYPKSDEALKRACLHNFYSVGEVDNLTNIIDAEQTVPSGLISMLQALRKHNLGNVISTSANPNRRKVNVVLSLAKTLNEFVAKMKFLHLSNGYLYYSFGIAPLIADMQKMSIASKTIQSALDKHHKHAGKLQTVRSKMQGTFDAPNTTGLTGLIGPHLPINTNTSYYWYQTLYEQFKPVKICTITGTKSFKYNTKLFNSVQYLQDKFLSAGPASALWEKIPYSFVVDWFVDMSSIIDAADNALSGGNRQIRDCCFSEKWNALVNILYQDSKQGEYTNLWGDVYGYSELSYYHREAWTPKQLSLSASGRFGKKQVALSAALLHQIVANLLKLKKK